MARRSDEKQVAPFVEPVEGEKAGRLWLRRMEHAIRWRQENPLADPQWKRNTELEAGRHWNDGNDHSLPKSDDPNERVTVNLTRAYVKDFLAFLFKNVPKFLARPRRKEDVTAARLQQALVNYFWQEKRWTKQARRAVRDMVRLGTGVVRTGWVRRLDTSARPDEHGLIELHDAIKQDEPVVKRVHPCRFLVDPTAPDQDLESARWVAEVIHKPLSDVLANVWYDEKVRHGIESGKYRPKKLSRSDDTENEVDTFVEVGDEQDGEDEARTVVRIFDVWDKKYRKHYLLLDGVKVPLLAENWPYDYLDGFPYVLGVFDEMNDEMFGEGLPRAMEDQQLELNRIRTGEFQHRRNYGRRRMAYLKNSLDPAQLAKLQSGDDADIEVNGVAIESAIRALDYPTLPEDNYRVQDSIKEDIRQLTGHDQLTSGGNLPSRTSATEINARSGYTGMKLDARVQVVDDFLADITRQVLQHMKANLQLPQAVRIQGPAGADWAMVSATDIAAETDLEIVTVSAERADENMLRQQAIQVYEKLMQAQPMLQMAGYQLNFERLNRWLLEEHFGVREYDEFITPMMPPPMMPGGAPGMGDGSAQMPVGIPGVQQAAQQAAVQPSSAALGGMMGSLGG